MIFDSTPDQKNGHGMYVFFSGDEFPDVAPDEVRAAVRHWRCEHKGETMEERIGNIATNVDWLADKYKVLEEQVRWLLVSLGEMREGLAKQKPLFTCDVCGEKWSSDHWCDKTGEYYELAE